ncbi:hypothetical protein Q5M85_13995 [Paraclostridium bifermentans]|nr:hypothetical protein [Paraclostridium bifermentans]
MISDNILKKMGIMLGNLNNCIEEARCTFIESPVRNYLMKEKNVPFKKIIKHNLEEVMNNFDILLEKPYSQLKLAIMGEVKSGKSTLVNAIVGREVSGGRCIRSYIIDYKYFLQ